MTSRFNAAQHERSPPVQCDGVQRWKGHVSLLGALRWHVPTGSWMAQKASGQSCPQWLEPLLQHLVGCWQGSLPKYDVLYIIHDFFFLDVHKEIQSRSSGFYYIRCTWRCHGKQSKRQNWILDVIISFFFSFSLFLCFPPFGYIYKQDWKVKNWCGKKMELIWKLYNWIHSVKKTPVSTSVWQLIVTATALKRLIWMSNPVSQLAAVVLLLVPVYFLARLHAYDEYNWRACKEDQKSSSN